MGWEERRELRKGLLVLVTLGIVTVSFLSVGNYLYVIAPINDVISARSYPMGDSSFLHYATLASDRGIIFSAYSGQSIWIGKLNENGTMEWLSTYPNSNITDIAFIYQGMDEGYVLAGSASAQLPTSRYFVAKIGASGVMEWNGTYGSGIARWVHQSLDGGYVSIGTDLNRSVLVVKTYSNGTMEWKRSHLVPATSYFWAQEFEVTSDGGCLVLALMYTTVNGSLELGNWIGRFDGEGNQLWNKTIYELQPWSMSTESIQETQGGGYILLHGTPTPCGGGSSWLCKLDSNFSTKWNIPFPEKGDSYPYELLQTSDGGYIAAVSATWVMGQHLWLWKVDENGTTQWRKPLLYGYIVVRLLYQTPCGNYLLVSESVDQNHTVSTSVVKVSGSPPSYPPEAVPLIYAGFELSLVLSIVAGILARAVYRRRGRVQLASSSSDGRQS